MAKRATEALLLSRDPDLADALDEALEPLGVFVIRNAPPPRQRATPPKAERAEDAPPLLIVDGRDYLDICRASPAGMNEGLPSPTLLLLGPEGVEALRSPLKADEVACLPLRPEEVRLRVRSLLGPPLYGAAVRSPTGRSSTGRSSTGRPSAWGRSSKARGGALGRRLRLDEERYEITLDGEALNLTYREYELLKYLMTHPGRTFTREHLLTLVWGADYLGGTRTVDVHIRRLRLKVEAGGREFIRTVRSVGYRFVG
ncbi:MAG: winged-helix domain-containing protein [Nitrospinota bacterium]